MKALVTTLLLLSLASCQGSRRAEDTAKDTATAATVRPQDDSARYRMPVQKTDSNRDKKMPVVPPEEGVQPK